MFLIYAFKGLEIEPENATMKQSLATTRAKLDEVSQVVDQAAPAATNGMPGMGGMGGMDFASMMSNPNFMSMAATMMQNPNISSMLNNPNNNFASMAQNLMQNPEALQGILANPAMASLAQNFMGGAGGAGGAGVEGAPPNANL